MARSAVRMWLAGSVDARVAPAGALLVLLIAVHERVLASVHAASAPEAIYLQLVVLCQCVLLAASVSAAIAMVPRLRRPLASLTFVLPALLYLDALVMVRIHRHLPALLALAFDAHVTENRKLLDATGVDSAVFATLFAALLVAGAAGIALETWCAIAGFPRPRVRFARRTFLAAWIGAGSALAGLQLGAFRMIGSVTWADFGRSVPSVMGRFGPTTRARASLRVSLRQLPTEALVNIALARLEVPTSPPPGDIYFFVVESLRADAIDPLLTPAMAEVARRALRIDTAISGGDVTQYGWSSLFRARPALTLDADRDGRSEGAIPLRIARRRGWRVEVLTSSDLGYMHIDEAVLGPARELADDIFDASGTAGTSATHDAQIMTELARRAARPHPATVFIVGLDATHLPYLWTDDFDPPLRPYAGPRHYMRMQTSAEERLAVVNRYRDAVAFVDSQLGRFFDGLRAAGTYDDATLVIVGDHGEEFWEHGLTAHASEVCAAQTHIALVLALSGTMHVARDAGRDVELASGIDVWPTILDAAGVAGDTRALFDGRSLLRGPVGAALSLDQAYWHRPGRLALDDGRHRLVLEMSDPDHPFRTQELLVLDLLDEADRSTLPDVPANTVLSEVRRTFGPDLDRFFVTRW